MAAGSDPGLNHCFENETGDTQGLEVSASAEVAGVIISPEST